MKAWKQLFITSFIAKIKRLKQCRKEYSTYKKHNTSCDSYIICESDDRWATYHNCLIIRKSVAWRCKKTIDWYIIIKRYWRPLSTISWWLHKILDTQNKNGILRTKQKTMRMPILTCDWILQKMSVRNVVQIREKQVQRYNLKYFIF